MIQRNFCEIGKNDKILQNNWVTKMFSVLTFLQIYIIIHLVGIYFCMKFIL